MKKIYKGVEIYVVTDMKTEVKDQYTITSTKFHFKSRVKDVTVFGTTVRGVIELCQKYIDENPS